MIRTTIIPKNTKLYLSIPKDFIGKQVEVLLFTTDEIKEDSFKNNISSLRGKLNLSNEQYSNFHQYLNDSRNEWSRDI
jgi:hypothetical protein